MIATKPWALDDPHVGVVDRREHRIRKTSTVDDTADAEAIVLVRVARLAALQAAAPLRHGKRPGLRRSRRETSIRRIDHERRYAARSCCIRANAGSAHSARPPCRRAHRPAPDRARHEPGPLRAAWHTRRRSGTVACRTAAAARRAHRIPLHSSTPPADQGRPTTSARATSSLRSSCAPGARCAMRCADAAIANRLAAIPKRDSGSHVIAPANLCNRSGIGLEAARTPV